MSVPSAAVATVMKSGRPAPTDCAMTISVLALMQPEGLVQLRDGFERPVARQRLRPGIGQETHSGALVSRLAGGAASPNRAPPPARHLKSPDRRPREDQSAGPRFQIAAAALFVRAAGWG